MKKIIIVIICILCIISATFLYAQSQLQTDSRRILIAYFSLPAAGRTDATTSASMIAVDGNIIGHVQHVANIIQRTTGGSLFEIQTVQTYPDGYLQLRNMARQERNNRARPILSTRIFNLQNYDTIFLGYPNWWSDMPMPLYSFLEEYNLSGKTIIPFCVNGGRGLSGTVETIIQLQPRANVVRDAFEINRNNLAHAERDVIAWLHRIGMVHN